MDFNDTPEEAEFRAEVRAFLEQYGDKYRTRDSFSRKNAKEWQAIKADAGYAAITWPTKFGGRGGSDIQQVIYDQEERHYELVFNVFRVGLGMCIPTLFAYASEEQLARYVEPALRGEELWCQLFSEPAAGSDLAGIRTKAEQDGDEWVINGQKIWTSFADTADFGILLARSDFEAPKHAGMTFFFIDMKSPGIECRPIKQITGDSHFCEVFFDDLRVPDSQRLGDIGQGWKVALTTLMNERMAVSHAGGPDFEEIFTLARSLEVNGEPALKNAAVREKLVDWYVTCQGLKYTNFRLFTALSQGAQPGPEASIIKLVGAEKQQEIASYGMDLIGMGGNIMDPELAPMAAAFQDSFLFAPVSQVAGGTNEIMRNIIAERVLGLPADIRVDKDVPFKDLPTGPKK